MSEYTQKMRQLDAKLAEAMGWTEVHFNPNEQGDLIRIGWQGVPPVVSSSYTYPASVGYPRTMIPLFQGVPLGMQSEHAKAYLLHWLAEDDERWEEFDSALYVVLLDGDAIRPDQLWRKAVMLATPAQIATAAAVSLGLIDKEESK